MSLQIRYLTNGEKEIFTVRNAGITPPTFEIFEKREDIDERIRHYAPKSDPVFCKPDLARIFGVLDIFYPNHPDCGRTDLKEHNVKKCIAEQCKYAPDGDWEKCGHYIGNKANVSADGGDEA